MHNVAPAGNDENRTESESSPIRCGAKTAPERLGEALRDIRKREVERNNAAGGILNFGSWETRTAQALGEKEGTFNHWVHGEAFPEWPSFEKLYAKFGRELLDVIYPPDADPETFTPDQVRELLQRHVENLRGSREAV